MSDSLNTIQKVYIGNMALGGNISQLLADRITIL